jgi:NAD-dependent dihydropyrimidine dehydrogenase PreA subunit
MSYTILEDICIGCGACDFACDTYAIHKRDNQRGTFYIDWFDCYDCGDCVKVCPVDCIVQDATSIICHGRGCPLNARSKWADWECSELHDLCARCGNVLWRAPGTTEWVCFSCDLGHRGFCPKIKGKQRHEATLVGA